MPGCLRPEPGRRHSGSIPGALLHPTRVWTGRHRPSRPPRLPRRDRPSSPSFSGKFPRLRDARPRGTGAYSGLTRNLAIGGHAMIRIVLALALGWAALMATTTASAADEPDELVPGRILLIKNGTLAKFVAKAPVAFDLPDANNAPTAEGGSLSIFDTGGPSSDTYTLPSGGWKGLGNPAGSKGYKYKGAGTVGDPCRVVLVKSKVVKAVCKGGGVQMATPFTGDAGIVLAIGTDTKNYCLLFGGMQVKNDMTQLKKKDAPAPGACPSPGGGGSTSTSTTTSSTVFGAT